MFLQELFTSFTSYTKKIPGERTISVLAFRVEHLCFPYSQIQLRSTKPLLPNKLQFGKLKKKQRILQLKIEEWKQNEDFEFVMSYFRSLFIWAIWTEGMGQLFSHNTYIPNKSLAQRLGSNYSQTIGPIWIILTLFSRYCIYDKSL